MEEGLPVPLRWTTCASRACLTLLDYSPRGWREPEDRYCDEHKILAELDRIDGTAEDAASFDF